MWLVKPLKDIKIAKLQEMSNVAKYTLYSKRALWPP